MSTVLVDRDAFLGPIGPVEEAIPGGYAEDYDWWVRAARHAPIPLVTEPQFQLRWGGQSYFRDKWVAMDEALGLHGRRAPRVPRPTARDWPASRPSGRFARAAVGRPRRRATRCSPRPRRTTPPSSGCPSPRWSRPGVSGDKVMAALNRIGRGI